MPIKSYRDLEVYKRAKSLVVPMYQLANSLPASEKYDLTDQIKRASKSVVANIVEGYSQRHSGQSKTIIVAKQLNKLIQNWHSL